MRASASSFFMLFFSASSAACSEPQTDVYGHHAQALMFCISGFAMISPGGKLFRHRCDEALHVAQDDLQLRLIKAEAVPLSFLVLVR